MARSRTRRTKSRTKQGPGLDLIQLNRILAKVQMVILLVSVVIVPLVVLPDSNFVDITSTPKTTILRILGTLQAGLLLSRLALAFTAAEQNPFIRSLRAIRSNRPVFAILGSITAVATVGVISASLSILPHQSWWGRVPAGFEGGEFTALMYIVMSTSAFITLREFGGSLVFWRTLALTGVLASLVGFFQYLGWSPLDISSTHSSKLTGTNGNPIFFGAMLVVLAPLTIGVLIGKYRSTNGESKRWWLGAIGIAAFLLALSLVATASRGPFLGVFAGGVVTIVLLLSFRQFRANIAPLIVVVLFAGFGALTATFVDPIPPEPGQLPDSADQNNSAVAIALQDVTRTSTLDLRIRYWKLSANMAIDRDPVPFTSEAPKVARWLFGYGPDMFRYAGTYFSDNTTFTRRLTAAHNDPINRLVEQGFLGFIAWMSLWVSVAYGSLVLVRRLSSSSSTPWIAFAITAALAGRFTEQLFGSPTPGGVLIFWVAVGGLASMLMKPSVRAETVSVPNEISPVAKYATYAGVLVITAVSVVLAWDRGANYLIANQLASFQYRPTVVSANEALERLERATKIAPDVARYWNDLAEIEQGRAAATQDPQVKSEALSRAYEYDLKAYETNPMESDGIYRLAFSAWEAGKEGRPELRQEAVRLYERLTEIVPSDELARERLEVLRTFLAE